MILSIIKNKPSRVFIVLAAFFVTNALLAEIMGSKLFSLEKTLGIAPANFQFFGHAFSFNLTAGVLLWPVVFIMTDIINEYYGPRGVRFLTLLTVVLIGYAFLMLSGAIGLYPADFWAKGYYKGVPDSNLAFAGIFGQSQSIIIASLAAFLLSQVLDVLVFHKIKKITGEKSIWLRATGSTVVSQFIDSFVVLFLAFYVAPRMTENSQPWSLGQVMSVCFGNYLYKFVVAVLLTPVIYLVHAWIERYMGRELAKEMKTAAMRATG